MPWRQWKQAFFNYFEAPEEAMPSNTAQCTWPEGAAGVLQSSARQCRPDIKKDSTDIFKEALAVLDKHFATTVNELMERHHFSKH